FTGLSLANLKSNGFNTTDGVDVTVEASTNSTTYCLKAHNTASAVDDLYYSSTTGAPGTTAC
ncbi:MAG: hypothetical protein M3290_13035, partial [Actinomycetota bacterium]|nr:hypothetical protein [Actinomycetota bacterium]